MADHDAPTFGPLLKRYRVRAGLSQEELAEAAGLSVRGISDLERGFRRSPQRETLRLLVEALGLTDREREELEAAVERRRGPSADFRVSPNTRGTAAAARHNVPPQSTSFIGREEEIEVVRGILLRPEVRLVTLTGMGGIGKSRLAVRAVQTLLGTFPDGVWFVDLSPIAEPGLVPAAIAQSLGLRHAADRPLVELLSDYLSDKQCLLVLDNFEQVLPAAPLIARLLSAAPELKVIVTSRAALRLSAEHVYPVPPLQLPDPARLPGLEAISRYESVRLFVERARAVKPDFRLADENAPAVSRICARLDGLPLAIELAAARLRLFDPEAMLSRLGGRLGLLSSGPRDAPERQRTLRATIDWSYRLLDEEERRLLRRLSVFSGGFTLEAAEAVCDPEGEQDVLGAVESLLDNSLLRQLEGVTGEVRFGMLETVREYATERLEEGGEAGELRRGHAEYFLGLTERAETELQGPGQLEWLGRLRAEHDNLRVSLGWSLREVPQMAMRLVGALSRYWLLHGHFVEWDGWLEAALASDAPEVDRVLLARARALLWRAVRAHLENDYARTIAHTEESLALFRRLEDQWGIAGCAIIAGASEHLWGDPEHGLAQLEAGVALARRLDNPWLTALGFRELGAALWIRDESARALPLLEEGVELARRAGDPSLTAWSLEQLGMALRRDDFGRAVGLFEAGLSIQRELRDKLGIAYMLFWLAGASIAEGDYARAWVLAQERLTIERELGNRRGISHGLHLLSEVALRQGDYERAEVLAESALETAREFKHEHYICLATEVLVRTAQLRGEYGHADELSEQELSRARELGDELHSAQAMAWLVETALLRGEYGRAMELSEQEMAQARESGDRHAAVSALWRLGWAAYHQGDYGTARAVYEERLTLERELNHLGCIAECLEGLAAVALAEGGADRGARLLGAAEALREAVKTPLHPVYHALYEPWSSAVRAQLGEEAFEAAKAQGRTMTRERAIEHALAGATAPDR